MIGALASRIDRRLLVTYRLDAAVARTLVPEHLDLDLVDGTAVAGICLIRLSRTRPPGAPPLGWGAENAAHRIAVRWRTEVGWERGVYIPLRHTASTIATIAGGRVFPGTHHRARIDATDDGDRLRVEVHADGMQAAVEGVTGEPWRSGLFADATEAAQFYRAGTIGLSPRRDGALEAVRLQADRWPTVPITLRSARSSFYDALPAGSAEPDSALMMRDLDVVWHRVDAPDPRTLGAPVG